MGRYQSPGTSFISSQYSKSTGYTWENTLNYHTAFGGSPHDVTFLLGQSMAQSVYENMRTEGDAGREHYYNSLFYDLSKISTETSTSAYTKSSLLSYFGRLNYKFRERYLLTASSVPMVPRPWPKGTNGAPSPLWLPHGASTKNRSWQAPATGSPT